MSKRHMLAAADEPLEFFDGEKPKVYTRKPEPSRKKVPCRVLRTPRKRRGKIKA